MIMSQATQTIDPSYGLLYAMADRLYRLFAGNDTDKVEAYRAALAAIGAFCPQSIADFANIGRIIAFSIAATDLASQPLDASVPLKLRLRQLALAEKLAAAAARAERAMEQRRQHRRATGTEDFAAPAAPQSPKPRQPEPQPQPQPQLHADGEPPPQPAPEPRAPQPTPLTQQAPLAQQAPPPRHAPTPRHATPPRRNDARQPAPPAPVSPGQDLMTASPIGDPDAMRENLTAFGLHQHTASQTPRAHLQSSTALSQGPVDLPLAGARPGALPGSLPGTPPAAPPHTHTHAALDRTALGAR
jgi:outer membrane biosynthesis protein TonB